MADTDQDHLSAVIEALEEGAQRVESRKLAQALERDARAYRKASEENWDDPDPGFPGGRCRLCASYLHCGPGDDGLVYCPSEGCDHHDEPHPTDGELNVACEGTDR